MIMKTENNNFEEFKMWISEIEDIRVLHNNMEYYNKVWDHQKWNYINNLISSLW